VASGEGAGTSPGPLQPEQADATFCEKREAILPLTGQARASPTLPTPGRWENAPGDFLLGLAVV